MDDLPTFRSTGSGPLSPLGVGQAVRSSPTACRFSASIPDALIGLAGPCRSCSSAGSRAATEHSASASLGRAIGTAGGSIVFSQQLTYIRTRYSASSFRIQPWGSEVSDEQDDSRFESSQRRCGYASL